MMVQPMWRATQFKRLFGLGLMRWRRAIAKAPTAADASSL